MQMLHEVIEDSQNFRMITNALSIVFIIEPRTMKIFCARSPISS